MVKINNIGSGISQLLTEGLTPRESEILQMIAEGFSNRMIAERLRISVQTVKNHVSKLMLKTNVNTRENVVLAQVRSNIDKQSPTDENVTHELAPMMTIREVSQLLTVHPNTVRRWGDMGVLRGYRIARRGDRRFKRQDIAAFVAELVVNRGVIGRLNPNNKSGFHSNSLNPGYVSQINSVIKS